MKVSKLFEKVDYSKVEDWTKNVSIFLDSDMLEQNALHIILATAVDSGRRKIIEVTDLIVSYGIEPPAGFKGKVWKLTQKQTEESKEYLKKYLKYRLRKDNFYIGLNKENNLIMPVRDDKFGLAILSNKNMFIKGV